MAKEPRESKKASGGRVAKPTTAKSSNRGGKSSSEASEWPRISKSEWDVLLLDPSTEQTKIMAYSVPVVGRTGFSINLKPNPDLVEMTPLDEEFEDAMGIGNDIERWRRYHRFLRAVQDFPTRPLLVSEGDSWFQFPFFVREVIDHLESKYNIACTAAAGDWAANMISGEVKTGGREYLSQIWRYKEQAEGFLLSAAGNDIIGEDPSTKKSALQAILKKGGRSASQPHEFLNHSEFAKRLKLVRDYYEIVINSIRQYHELKTLPIIFHGYDYPFPFEGPGDDRKRLWVREGARWLAPAFEHYGIKQEFRRPILMLLIDALYDLLSDLAGDSTQTHIWVVDCRRTLTKRSDWEDEIHGTSEGFAKIAKKFEKTIEAAREARKAT